MESKVKLPKDVTVADLSDNFNIATTEYSRAFKKARLLDMVDKNKLWEAIGAKFPAYQILPETNHVSYIKNNLLASIYTVGKSARLLPTSEKDKEMVENLNVALEHIWSQLKVPYYEMRAGERAALLNLGVTQVGWDNNIVGGEGDNFYKGRCKLKNINPLKYMRDPYAEDLDTAAYVITWSEYHKSVLLRNPNYAEAFKAYLKENPKGSTNLSDSNPMPNTDRVTNTATTRTDYYKVVTHWVRVSSVARRLVKPRCAPRLLPRLHGGVAPLARAAGGIVARGHIG
jgi:hypothetical protein